MKQLIIIILLFLFIFVIYYKYDTYDMNYITSDIDNKKYLVRNRIDKKKAANLLANINKNINILSDYLNNNIDKYKEYEQYILQLKNNISNTTIRETSFNNENTSYTINKGDTINFCIRNKAISKLTDNSNIHDINLVMYVALHEISHVACPEYNHTPLFNKIFKFFCNQAIILGIYKKIDYNKNPIIYCGIEINSSII